MGTSTKQGLPSPSRLNSIMKETLIAELELDPVFCRKRRIMIFVYMVRMFLIGVEYSVILPSAWLYLRTFGVDTRFMGLVISSYPLAGMIVLPIVGRIYDRTLRNTEIVLALNAFLIVGNIIYAIPISKWFPLIGRFLAGIGDGFAACATGEVAHIYPAEKRTAIFAMLELGRVFGLILGPGLNFFIAKTSFELWTWRINNATMPGALMAFSWILMEVLTCCCTYNLALEIVILRNNRERNDPDYNSVANMSDESSFSDSDFLVKKEKSEHAIHEMTSLVSKDHEAESRPSSLCGLSSACATLSQLLAVEFVVLFYVDVVLWLAQTEFEILLPLVTESDYGWKQEQVGLVYIIGGFQLVFVFGLIYVLAQRQIRDTYMLIASLLFTLLAMNLMILEAYLRNLLYRMIVFGVICLLVFSSIPLNLVSSKSVLSKVTETKDQGLLQGFYSGISRVALVIGPLLGSVAFYNRKLYGMVSSALCLVGLVALISCLGKLHTREAEMRKKQSDQS